MFTPFLLAFALSVSLTPLFIVALRRMSVLDIPNHRSSHHYATPRGGGSAVAIAVILSLGLTSSLSSSAWGGFLVAAGGCGLLGMLDDIMGVPAIYRLVILLCLAGASLPWLMRDIDEPLIWQVVYAFCVVLWVVSYVNAYNFMDGINGLAVGQAGVAGVAWLLLGGSTHADDFVAVATVVAAAALGFAPYNAVRARVFLGDVGSYFIGGALAYGAVLGINAGLPPESVLAPLAIYLADTGVTLLRRIARGESWHQAHRQHVYQLLTESFGGSHIVTMVTVVLYMVVVSALGGVSIGGSLIARIAADIGIIVVIAAYLFTPHYVAHLRRIDSSLA